MHFWEHGETRETPLNAFHHRIVPVLHGSSPQRRRRVCTHIWRLRRMYSFQIRLLRVRRRLVRVLVLVLRCHHHWRDPFHNMFNFAIREKVMHFDERRLPLESLRP